MTYIYIYVTRVHEANANISLISFIPEYKFLEAILILHITYELVQLIIGSCGVAGIVTAFIYLCSCSSVHDMSIDLDSDGCGYSSNSNILIIR